jgi:hypothetical protein
MIIYQLCLFSKKTRLIIDRPDLYLKFCVSETICFPVSSKRENNLRNPLQKFGLCGMQLFDCSAPLPICKEKVMVVHSMCACHKYLSNRRFVSSVTNTFA